MENAASRDGPGSGVFDPRTKQFDGRIFKNTGDGALAEFGSAVDAVQCAVEIQRALAQRNADWGS